MRGWGGGMLFFFSLYKVEKWVRATAKVTVGYLRSRSYKVYLSDLRFIAYKRHSIHLEGVLGRICRSRR